MCKITVEESEVCQQFMQSCVSYILPLPERKFVNLTHVVSCDDFIVLVSYDKKTFGGRIQQFIREITKEAQRSDLHRYHWAVHCLLVEEIINQPYELFHDCIVIPFTVELKKIMTSSLHALINNFKQQLKIPNNVATWISKEREFVITVYCLEKDMLLKK